MVPREGLEPTRPHGQRILSPPRLPFRHLGIRSQRKSKRRDELPALLCANNWRRRADSNRRIEVLQTSALTAWLRRPRPKPKWCRGRDLNPHRLTPTTPSRWRVYQFHHLGRNPYFTTFFRSFQYSRIDTDERPLGNYARPTPGKAGITSFEMRAACSWNCSIVVPMGQAIIIWSSPGYLSSTSLR